MRSERFRPLATAQGPFVSVYLDDSRDSADALPRLETEWRDVRKHLVDWGADDAILDNLEGAVLRSRPAVGRRGRCVIATREQVLINEHLISPPPATVLRMSDYPYLVPLVDGGMQHPTYVFAAVDHAGADLTLHQGDVVRSETVDGGGYPVHKPVTAGFNGYGDLQPTVEEAIRKNVRAVAERITELVDRTGAQVVFVSGEVRSRTDVVSALPERVAARVSQLHAGARTSRVDENEVRELIDDEFERRRRAETVDVAARFETENGRRSGLAVEGLPAVCVALRAGEVDALIIGDLGDATVVRGEARTTIAPDADALSELGEAPRGVPRADEALPFVATTVGASLLRADDRIAPADGIAALLRYVPTDAGTSGPTTTDSVVAES